MVLLLPITAIAEEAGVEITEEGQGDRYPHITTIMHIIIEILVDCMLITTKAMISTITTTTEGELTLHLLYMAEERVLAVPPRFIPHMILPLHV